MSDQRLSNNLPSIDELGLDLLRISPIQRCLSAILPFALIATYFALAYFRIWWAGVVVLMYLSFVTYGSISHDLVHRTLGLPRRLNEFLLTTVELLVLRSGHAYRLAHLHHHARFPDDDDIEGAAAKMGFGRTIFEGIIFQPKIMLWAAIHHGRRHPIVLIEIAGVLIWLTLCMATISWTPVLAVYAALMIAGSWIIPLMTSYIPHNADGRSMLTQTRLFRGKVASIIAMEHLYHLEHHLYPSVPHHNWPELARRLDPYFQDAKLQPIVLGF